MFDPQEENSGRGDTEKKNKLEANMGRGGQRKDSKREENRRGSEAVFLGGQAKGKACGHHDGP